MKKTLADTLYNPNQDNSWEEYQEQEVARDKFMEYVIAGRL